ncbi:MAG: SHOCT domain-containing protein [Inquilinaceae bacterium]
MASPQILMAALTAVLVAAGAAPPAAAQVPSGGPYWGGSWGYGHMAFGFGMMALFWGGIIVAIVLLVRWLGSSSHPHPPPGREALDILRERFARGEIDRAEYEERRRLLLE